MSYRNYSTANGHIVDNLGNGDYTTIQAAITAASAGQTIFIRPKSDGSAYAENLTLKAGVNLTAFDSDFQNATVNISGKATFTGTGTVVINGIELSTNSDFFLVVSGSAASVVILNECKLNCLNNTGISYTSSNIASGITANYCTGDIATTGIALFAASGAGNIIFNWGGCSNSGASTTANTISAGTLGMNYYTINNPITTSGTSSLNHLYSQIGTVNVIGLTAGGSGGHQSFYGSFTTGTASAISVSVGCVLNLLHPILNTSNANAITGAGTISSAEMSFFTSNPKAINTTTQTWGNSGAFTPVLTFGGGSTGITYTTQLGKYYRLDNIVYINVDIVLSNKGSSTGVSTISGLPFTSANDGSNRDLFMTAGPITAATATQVSASLGNNSSGLIPSFWVASTGVQTVLTNAHFQNTTELRIQGFYFI